MIVTNNLVSDAKVIKQMFKSLLSKGIDCTNDYSILGLDFQKTTLILDIESPSFDSKGYIKGSLYGAVFGGRLDEVKETLDLFGFSVKTTTTDVGSVLVIKSGYKAD